MKNRHVCPKCAHREILFVPELLDSDGDTLTVKTKLLSVWTGDSARFGQLPLRRHG